MYQDILIAIQARENLNLGAVTVTLDESTNTSSVKVNNRVVALVNPLVLKVNWRDADSEIAKGVLKALVDDRTKGFATIDIKAQTVVIGYRGEVVEHRLTSWIAFS